MKAFLQKKPAESDFHVHARTSRIRVYFLKPFSLILLTFMSIRKDDETKIPFLVFFIFDMPRIPQNLRERASGMPNAGIMMNAVATNIECSTRAI